MVLVKDKTPAVLQLNLESNRDYIKDLFQLVFNRQECPQMFMFEAMCG